MPFSVPFHQAATCINHSLLCFRAIDWFSTIDWVNNVDWYDELKLMTTSVLMASVV